ncbi:Squalene/phytoene synthase-domain-containing protein [Phycomyces nitens]|nr:Squalene/phytoene synthase-domain-containing protein [Phycomyces nitens]
MAQILQLADAATIGIIAALAVTISGLFTRWSLPILFIRPGANPSLYNMIGRGGLFLITLSSQVSHFSCWSVLWHACFFSVWSVSGVYLLRRGTQVVLSSLVAAILGMACIQLSPSASIMDNWQFHNWFAFASLVVATCNAMDHLDALLNTFPHLVLPDPRDHYIIQNPLGGDYWRCFGWLLFHMPTESKLPPGPIDDLRVVIRLLGPASRSWKTMSALFPANLRHDLCLLYSFFRTADDLIDNASNQKQARDNFDLLQCFLRQVFSTGKQYSPLVNDPTLSSHINWSFYASQLPRDTLAVFRSFARVSVCFDQTVVNEMVNAWRLDLKGESLKHEEDLLRYADLVSGTFGEMCANVIMYKGGHGNWKLNGQARKDNILKQARAVGQCLQLINIARDILSDSLDGKCYVPLQYMLNPLQEFRTLTVCRRPFKLGRHTLKLYALRILELADQQKELAYKGIEGLPSEVCDGFRGAFEVYMAISNVLRQNSGYPLRAKVPVWRQRYIGIGHLYGLFRLLENMKNGSRRLVYLSIQSLL